MLLTGASASPRASLSQWGKAMAANEKNGGGRGVRLWRIAAWIAVITVILLVPLVAMQFTDEVAWTLSDFIFAGALIGAVGVTYELAAIRGAPLYRAGVGVVLAAAFMLIWINGAVGVIGDEGNAANLMYGGVLGIALAGAIAARFRSAGMASAMLGAAVAQAVVGALALAAGWGVSGPIWPWDVLFLTGFFTALWLLSAWLFRQAARGQASARTAP